MTQAAPPAEYGPSPMRAFYLRHEYGVIVAISAIVYIALGLQLKFLLTWIIGPLWPVVWIAVVPPLVRRLTGWTDPLPYAVDEADTAGSTGSTGSTDTAGSR